MWLLAAWGCHASDPPGAPALGPSPEAYARPALVPTAVVDCTGAGDHTSIQAAIDAARDRDVIEVRPCRYDERIDFRGKTLAIFSTGGPGATTIDADGAGSAVRARHGESAGTALIGFTLEDGDDPAVDVRLSSLRLQDVVFEDTTGDQTIASESGNLELVRVTIDERNESDDQVIAVDRGSVVIVDSTIACGDGDGLLTDHGGFLLDRTTVRCSGRTAVADEHAVGLIERSRLWGDVTIESEETHPDDLVALRNVFLDGDLTAHWGTMSIVQSVFRDHRLTFVGLAPTLTLRNNVFLEADCAIDADVVPTAPFTHNVFWDTEPWCRGPFQVDGWEHNRQTDPMFVDEPNEDFHLLPGSPLIDGGVAEAGWEDVDGSVSDIGLYGGHFTPDGGW